MVQSFCNGEGNNILMRTISDVSSSIPGIPSTAVEKGSTWLAAMIHSSAASGGVFLSFFMKDVAQSYSVSLLGSDMLLSSLTEALDPICQKFNLPSFRNMPPAFKTIVHSGIVWLAVTKQSALAGKLSGSGPIFKLLLKVEDAVTKAFFS